MKKSLLMTMSVLLTLVTLNAKAEFYVGVDLIGHTASFDAKKDANSTADYKLNNSSNYSSSGAGFGFNFGYRFNVAQRFFIAPEYSYEFLNSRSHLSYNNNTASSIDLQIESRSLLKLNLGYKINKSFEVFAFGGFGGAKAQLTDIGLLGDTNVGSSSSAVIGAGSFVNLTQDWVLKFAYDYQSIKVKRNTVTGFISTYEVPETSIGLHTVKAGLMYKF